MRCVRLHVFLRLLLGFLFKYFPSHWEWGMMCEYSCAHTLPTCTILNAKIQIKRDSVHKRTRNVCEQKSVRFLGDAHPLLCSRSECNSDARTKNKYISIHYPRTRADRIVSCSCMIWCKYNISYFHFHNLWCSPKRIFSNEMEASCVCAPRMRKPEWFAYFSPAKMVRLVWRWQVEATQKKYLRLIKASLGHTHSTHIQLHCMRPRPSHIVNTKFRRESVGIQEARIIWLCEAVRLI